MSNFFSKSMKWLENFFYIPPSPSPGDPPVRVSREEILKIPTDEYPMTMPYFPGGLEALSMFVNYKTRYPRAALQTGIHGKVYIDFVINTTGKITHLSVLKGVSPELDEEAMRVISIMPNWIPAQSNGQPVAVRYTLPITFRFK